MSGPNSTSDLGNLFRLGPYPVAELPQHPDIHENNSPSLAVFLKSLLDQASSFADEIDTRDGLWTSKGEKPFTMDTDWGKHVPASHPIVTYISIFYRNISAAQIKAIAGLKNRETDQEEHWFARRSTHHNAWVSGTADFKEFEQGIKFNHSDNENAYTPAILHAHKVCEWTDTKSVTVEGYSDITMEIREMVHKIPLFANRVFPVLVVTARVNADQFLVAQIALSGVEAISGSQHSGNSKLVVGSYSSVERVRLVPTTTTHDNVQSEEISSSKQQHPPQVEWLMATASDARGNIPMCMQKPSIPGAIAHDVGLFLKWINLNSSMRKDPYVSKDKAPWQKLLGRSQGRRRESGAAATAASTSATSGAEVIPPRAE